MTFDIRNLDLCSYTDGECADADRRRIAAALAASPQLTERLDLWRRNDASLRLALAVLEIPAASCNDPVETPTGPPINTETTLPRPLASTPLTTAALATMTGASGFVALALATLLYAGR